MLFIVFNVTYVMWVIIGYTRRHLRNPAKGHEHQSYAIAKYYKTMHGKMSQDLLKRFEALKKCGNFVV